MRLTTRGRYAVTAMIYLATSEDGKPIALRTIAEEQGLSLSYLEQLFSKLRQNELVVSNRGPGGGYRLACDADQISVADIITAVDEPLDITNCDGKENCNQGQRCLSHDLWTLLSEELYGFLHRIKLGELISRSGVGGKLVPRSDALHVAVPEIS